MRREREEDSDTIKGLRGEVRDLQKELKMVKIQMIVMQGGEHAQASVGMLLQEIDDMDDETEKAIVQEKIDTFRRKWGRRKRERAERAVGSIFAHWRDWAQ